MSSSPDTTDLLSRRMLYSNKLFKSNKFIGRFMGFGDILIDIDFNCLDWDQFQALGVTGLLLALLSFDKQSWKIANPLGGEPLVSTYFPRLRVS